MATRTNPRARTTPIHKCHLQLADPCSEDPATLADRTILSEVIAAAVNRLDPLMKTVLILRYRCGYSLELAAKILRHHVGRIRCLEAGAIRRLRARLQQYD